jgi:hypothetical protein
MDLWRFTLWLFNIPMENGPFIDDFPIKASIYKGFSMAMLNNQMVSYIIHLSSTSRGRRELFLQLRQLREIRGVELQLPRRFVAWGSIQWGRSEVVIIYPDMLVIFHIWFHMLVIDGINIMHILCWLCWNQYMRYSMGYYIPEYHLLCWL